MASISAGSSLADGVRDNPPARLVAGALADARPRTPSRCPAGRLRFARIAPLGPVLLPPAHHLCRQPEGLSARQPQAELKSAKKNVLRREREKNK